MVENVFLRQQWCGGCGEESCMRVSLQKCYQCVWICNYWEWMREAGAIAYGGQTVYPGQYISTWLMVNTDQQARLGRVTTITEWESKLVQSGISQLIVLLLKNQSNTS